MDKKWIYHLAALLVAITLTGHATPVLAAATYYVSTKGNDANSGSNASEPLLGIQTAIDKTSPGDTVYILPGTYELTTQIAVWKKCGAADKWITISGSNPQNTILDASRLPAGSNAFFIGGTTYSPRTASSPGSTNSPACFVQLKHLAITNAPVNGVDIMVAHDIALVDLEISGSTKNGVSTSGPGYNISLANLYIHDNVLEHKNAPPNVAWDQAVRLSDVSSSSIENSTVVNNWGEGIDVLSRTMDGSSNIVKGNYLKNNYGTSIYVDHALNTTITGNFITSDNPAYNAYGAPATGIAVADEGGEVTGNSSGTVVTNNIVVGALYGFRYGGWGLGVGLKNTSVWNNTFVNSAFAGIGIDDPTHGANSGNSFSNNIFYLTVPYSVATNILSPMAGLTFNNNLWYGATKGRIMGTSGAYANPDFVGTCSLTSPADCYRLKNGSPAIGLGIPHGSLTYSDFANVKRQNPPTAGALEYITNKPVPVSD